MEGVGPFKAPKTIEFKPGLNVVYGRNEAGKSTLMRTIETLFFGFKPIKDWKYAGWESGETLIEGIVAETDEVNAHVSRRYGSKIRGNVLRGHVADVLGNNALWEDRIDIELYKSMFSMSTDELSGIGKKSWKELNDSLTDNYNSEVFKTAHEVVTDLDALASALYRENGRGQFEMKRVKEDQKSLEEQLRGLQIEHAYAIKSAEEKRMLKSNLELLNVKLATLDRQIKEHESMREALHIRSELSKIQTEADLLELLDLPSREHLDAFKHAMTRLVLVKQQKQQQMATLIQLEQAVAEIERTFNSKKTGRSALRVAIALVAVAAAGIGTWYWLPGGLTTQEQWAIAGLVGVAVLATVNIRVSAYFDRKKANAKAEGELSTLSAEKLTLEGQIKSGEEEAVILLESVNEVSSWLENHTELDAEQANELRLRLDYLKSRQSELLALQPAESLNLNAKDSDTEITVASLLEKRDHLTEQKIDIEKQLAHNTELTPKEIEFRMNELEKKIDLNSQSLWQTAIQRDRMLFASKIVSAAEQQYRHSQRPDFLIKASRFMKLLSDGRYEEILMTEAGGFVLKENSRLTPVGESTSRGTKEQMYMAIKIALMTRLDPLGRYPLLLDEVVINFDEQRRLGFYKMIEEIGKERQIIMATCHEWLLEEMRQTLPFEKIYLETMKFGLHNTSLDFENR